MENHQAPIQGEPDRRERKYALATFVLACALVVTILTAIGYGVLNSSRVAATIPVPAGLQRPIKSALPQHQPGAPAAAPTTGTVGASTNAGSPKSR